MLNHLFATILICLGVANTTPISNYEHKKSNLVLTTPKKANIQTDYILNLRQNGAGDTTYTQDQAYQITPWIDRIRDREQKANESGNNNWLNVLGTAYATSMQGQTLENGEYVYKGNLFLNYDKVEDDNNYDNQWVERITYIYKITTYNFNINTTIRINQAMTISASNGVYYGLSNLYIRKRVFKISKDNRLDQYINQQQTTHQGYNLIDNITNVNNGFYYTQTTEIIDLETNELQLQSRNFPTDIELIPNDDNYIIMDFQMVEKATVSENTVAVISNGYVALTGTGAKITGTGIIPENPYEIIDIPGLMYEVIGMPFAFVSQAFNLTLFPGTPYQINIANLFLSIAAIFVFVWLLLLFIKMKG